MLRIGRFFFFQNQGIEVYVLLSSPTILSMKTCKDQDVWGRGLQMKQPDEGAQRPVMQPLLSALHMDEVVGLCGRQTLPLHFQLSILATLWKLTCELISFPLCLVCMSNWKKKYKSKIWYEMWNHRAKISLLEFYKASETRTFTFCYFVLFPVDTLPKTERLSMTQIHSQYNLCHELSGFCHP